LPECCLLTAALDGSPNQANVRSDPYVGFAAPAAVPGVEPHLIEPVKTRKDKAEFVETARRLIGWFKQNVAKFESHVGAGIRDAGPTQRTNVA
jgi:phosphoenolpyruvate carboxykinase (ATP)